METTQRERNITETYFYFLTIDTFHTPVHISSACLSYVFFLNKERKYKTRLEGYF